MATKLGDRLIAKGVISLRQLDMALKAQLIVGGHLGTCFLELGLLDEAALGIALSEAFGVPYAPTEALQEIPEETISLVTAKVAEEYKVIPFRMTDKVLHIAMVEPGNLPMLDALSFATDLRIVPWVSPELRIYQALEQYYGVPRRLRYIGICRALDNAADKADGARKASGGYAGAEALSNADGGGKTVSEASSASSSPVTLGMIGDGQQDFADFQYGKHWHEVAAELRLDDPSSAETQQARPASTGLSVPGHDDDTGVNDLTAIADRLCRADRKDDIAEAVMAYTTARMSRCILFSVQSSNATVWLARGFSPEPRKEARIPLTSGAFGLLLGNEMYRGVVPREEIYETFYSQLGIDQPAEVLLVPIYLSDRLVAVFHGDGGLKKRIEGDTDAYLRLFRLFSLTLSLLVMKNRIHDAAHPAPEIRKAKPAGPELYVKHEQKCS